MNLVCGQIRPGKVLKILDSNGTIKGSCAGVFSMEDDPEKLPPIYPFLRTSPSQFVKPNIGDDIWVLCFTDNPQELFYIFQGGSYDGSVRDKQTGDLEKYNNNVQILMSCDSGFEGAHLQFSNEEGWSMQNDSVVMTMGNENDLEIKNDNGSFSMDDSGIHLSGDSHSVARGDVVMSKFNDLENMLKLFAKTLSMNQFTATAGASLENLINSYMTGYDEIESPQVTTK